MACNDDEEDDETDTEVSEDTLEGASSSAGVCSWINNCYLQGYDLLLGSDKMDDHTLSNTPSTECSEKRELSSTSSESLERECHSFDLVFVFPAARFTNEEEEEQFEARHLTPEHPTYADVIRHLIIPHDLRKTLSIGQCQTLKEARTCAIEILQAFFTSLSVSLKASIEVFVFSSESAEELFLCVRLSDEIAEAIAEMDEYPVQLCLDGLESLHIKLSDQGRLVPAYVTFDSEIRKHNLYKTYAHPQLPGEEAVLRHVDHMRVLYAKVTDYLNIHEMQRLGLLKSFFSDHSKYELMRIRERWANPWLIFSLSQPIEEVRDYFGESLAFYFLFLEFMIRGFLVLMFPAVVCMSAILFGKFQEARMGFAIFLVMWSQTLVKLWARQTAYYGNKWGMDRHEASGILEPLNPDFHGTKKPSMLDENIYTLQPDKFKRRLGYAVSGIVSLLFTCFVLCAFASNRYWMRTVGIKYEIVSALVLSAQIQLGEKIWDSLLVEPLNRLEQHTTLYSYDQSRVAKSFVIKFVNSSVAFLYIAYLMPLLDPEPCEGNCSGYLRHHLLIVFATYISFGLVDIVFPYATMRLTACWEERHARLHGYETFNISLLEQQFMMLEYTGADEQDAYLCIVMPLCFVLMFASIAPAIVLLAYFSLIVQLRAHAWKFCSVLRRPFPVPASGIGTWETIFPWLVTVSNWNCIGMLIVSSDQVCSFFPGFGYITDILEIPSEGRGARLVLFFILQFCAGVWHRLLEILLPDIPAETKQEMERQDLQRDRLAHKSHAVVHEQIALNCTGDAEKCGLQDAAPLREGHPMYTAPFLRT